MSGNEKRKISIEGVVYESMWAASKSLDIPYPTIQTRVLSKNKRFDDWMYADGKPPPEGRKKKLVIRSLPGCYTLVNQKNGLYYIGSSTNVKSRKGQHLFNLRHGKHPNQDLQNAWDASEEEDWKFTMFLTNDLSQAKKMEQSWITEYWGDDKMLNKSKDVYSPLHGIEGVAPPKRTEEEAIERRKVRKQHYKDVSSKAENDNRYGDASPNSKPVIVSGTRFPSLAVASIELGIHVPTLRTRCNSENRKFIDYRWAKRGGDKGSLFPRPAKEDDYLPIEAKDGESRVRRPKVPGLIIVRHLPTGKVYVGGSVNVYRVVNEEEKRLRRGKHDNSELQELYDAQGKEVEVSVIELEPGTNVKAAKQAKIVEIGPDLCCNKVLRYSA